VVPPPGREEVRANLANQESVAQAAAATMAPLAAMLRSQGLDVRVQTAVSERPAEELARIVRDEEADLLVCGAHQPYVGRNPLGGVVADVLEECPTSIAVVLPAARAADTNGDGPVTVWYGGGPHSQAALELGARLARGRRSALRVVYPGTESAPAPAMEMEAIAVASREVESFVAAFEGASTIVVAFVDRGEGSSFGPRRDRLIAESRVPVVVVQPRVVQPA
jgi:nucleotide-binding universal stress UspA family protein